MPFEFRAFFGAQKTPQKNWTVKTKVKEVFLHLHPCTFYAGAPYINIYLDICVRTEISFLISVPLFSWKRFQQFNQLRRFKTDNSGVIHFPVRLHLGPIRLLTWWCHTFDLKMSSLWRNPGSWRVTTCLEVLIFYSQKALTCSVLTL